MTRALVLLVIVACRDRDAAESQPTEPTIEPMAQAMRPSEPDINAEKLGYVGVLTPRESSEVIAPFTTTVVELDVKLGDRVERGQRLARLDDRPLREDLAIAQATLKATQAGVAQADIERKAAHAALEREQRALKENVVSQAEVSAAEFNDRKASTAVAHAAATVEEERAKIAVLQSKLTSTSLLAQLGGRVALIYAQPGDRVDEGHPVLRVISSDELFVKFAIPADKIGTVAPGDQVEIIIDQQNVKTTGVVRHVAPELDPIAQMILADAELTTAIAALQAGVVCRIIPKSKAKP